MPRSTRRRSKKAGLAPGTLVHIGEARIEGVKITRTLYNEAAFEAREVKSLEECFDYPEDQGIAWINVDGIHQLDKIEDIGAHYRLHPLTLEDVVNTEQRPKMEDYDDYLFVVLKMFFWMDEGGRLEAEQVSLVVKPGLVLSFQEKEGDVFQPVRERLKGGKGRIRRFGADYLAYALMDAVVDHYFLILERLGERIEDLEEQLVADPKRRTLQDIHRLKREMIFLRKSVWPLREVINNMLRGESPIIRQETHFYLRDVYDHTIQVIDTIETFREMLSGMIDVYLSSISNRMNEVMKVLTIIATLFIPLTFLAGLYGMNFKYMPELEWHWGYPMVLLVMLTVTISMLVYFRRKKWL